MGFVKVLEKKGVIQFFGIALILAPFVNMIVSLAMYNGVVSKWSPSVAFNLLKTTGSWVHFVLYTASFVIGLIMLRGSTKAWKFVLALVGAYIAYQIMYIGRDLKQHWVAGIFFLINIGVFLFIADQLVWKQKKATTPPMRKKIPIHFQGFGQWGVLVSISDRGLYVKAKADAPPGLADRDIEVSLQGGWKMRARLAKRDGANFFFAYQNLSAQEKLDLRNWLMKQAA